MHTHEAPSTAPKTRPQAGGEVTSSNPDAGIQLIEDKRPEAILQRKLIESIKVHTSGSAVAPGGVVQRTRGEEEEEEVNTGLPFDDVNTAESLKLALDWLLPQLQKKAHNGAIHMNPVIGRSAVAVAGASAETGHAYTSSNPGGLGGSPESSSATDEEPEFNAGDIMENNDFIKYFTLIPGIKYSKVAQDLKLKTPENYSQLRSDYNIEYLKIKQKFEQKTIADVNKNPYSIQSPNQSLKDLDVMHPKSENEGTLIIELDQKNTALNQTIAASLSKLDPEDEFISEQDRIVEEKGGITAKHSAAFRKMLELRQETGSVLFRPAGKHAVKHLNKNMPAKPLWIKGKSIDLSKLEGEQIWVVLLAELQSSADGLDLEQAKDLLKNLKQGFIPTNQLYAKALRASFNKIKIEEGDRVTPSIIEHISKDIEKANIVINEMLKSGLIDVSEELYVASPGDDPKPYTGDYDMYSISNVAPELQHQQLNAIRAKGRGKIRKRGKEWSTFKMLRKKMPGSSLPEVSRPYTKEDVEKMQGYKNPFTPMANQKNEKVPDGNLVHKLFGNISRYEMGMKIDLNSAAITWGDYKAGQVIKHGAESRNFAFPQEILDGIVEMNQEKSVYKEDATDEKVEGHPDLKFFNPSLVEIANRLASASHVLPLNPMLIEAISKIQSMLPPILAGRFNVESSTEPPAAPLLSRTDSTDTHVGSDGEKLRPPTPELEGEDTHSSSSSRHSPANSDQKVSFWSLAGGGDLRGVQPKGTSTANYIAPNTSVTLTLTGARAYVAGQGPSEENRPKKLTPPSTQNPELANQRNNGPGRRPFNRLFSLVQRGNDANTLNNQTD